MEYQLIDHNATGSVVEKVLINRGISPFDIAHYLNTSDSDILDPSLIANIEEGVKMLLKHIAQNDKILIQIDSD